MAGYFEDKLLDLLPPVYRKRDIDGDLAAFLRVPAMTLDEIKELIDRLPDLFDIDWCDVRFIPLLANIVGYSFDPIRDPDAQRREIREVIESYRRKGSIPAIHRSLVNVGWKGRIDETFHTAIRLNRRSRVGIAKIPGRIHSLGVYRIECDNLVPGMRAALVPHHPAGTKVFFLQWLLSRESMEDHLDTGFVQVVTALADMRPRDTFIVGRDRMNSDHPLSKRQSTWSYWTLINQSTLTQGFESAGVVVSRWHGRTPGHKLNGLSLNTKRLIDVELSERRLELTGEIETEEPSVKPIIFRLVREHLNRSKLTRSTRSFRFLFRQEDFVAYAQSSIDMATNLYRVTRWPGG